jgi:hypothetical protein
MVKPVSFDVIGFAFNYVTGKLGDKSGIHLAITINFDNYIGVILNGRLVSCEDSRTDALVFIMADNSQAGFVRQLLLDFLSAIFWTAVFDAVN